MHCAEDMIQAVTDMQKRGYAIHWLHPRSKVPILENWAQRPVMSIDKLYATYRSGYNIGVRCGRWSITKSGYALLTDDPAHGPIIDAMASHQAAKQFGLVETAVVMGSVLFVLGTHVKVERNQAGKWTFRFEKKPTDAKLLTSLLEKLAGWIPSNK